MIVNASGHNIDYNSVELLWENKNDILGGTSGDTEVEVDWTGYDILYISVYSTNNKESLYTSPVLTDLSMSQSIAVHNSKYVYSRNVTVIENGLLFGQGYCSELNSGSMKTGNSYAVPYRIYGKCYRKEGS